MTAQEILSLIENVSPDDVAMQGEIDARVFMYLENVPFAALKHNSIYRLCPDTQNELPSPALLRSDRALYGREKESYFGFEVGPS